MRRASVCESVALLARGLSPCLDHLQSAVLPGLVDELDLGGFCEAIDPLAMSDIFADLEF